MELFWRQGFHATSMQQLVDHLGINRASIYATYGSKEELFQQAFAHYRATRMAAMEAFLAQYDAVKEGIKQLLFNAVSACSSDPYRKGCMVVNATTELVPGDQELVTVCQANQKEVEQVILTYLQQGVDSGELSANKDLPAIAAYFFTLYNGLQVVGKYQQDEQALLKAIQEGLSVLD